MLLSFAGSRTFWRLAQLRGARNTTTSDTDAQTGYMEIHPFFEKIRKAFLPPKYHHVVSVSHPSTRRNTTLSKSGLPSRHENDCDAGLLIETSLKQRFADMMSKWVCWFRVRKEFDVGYINVRHTNSKSPVAAAGRQENGSLGISLGQIG